MSRDMNPQRVVIEDTKADEATPTMAMTTTHPPMFFHTTIRTLPTIPSKPLFALALFLCTLGSHDPRLLPPTSIYFPDSLVNPDDNSDKNCGESRLMFYVSSTADQGS